MKTLLAIESSCDETSVAIIENGHLIKANIIASQIKTHKKFGGVVPEVASRLHVECINNVIKQALDTAQITFTDLTAIAVTMGPGLEGCLLVGISVAKTLAISLNIPLIPVNHLHGHIYAHKALPSPTKFPCIALLVSGGHTELIHCEKEGIFKKCGQTRDDAAGEVLDKVARALDLGYPGGPVIEKTAKDGNPKAYPFPIPLKQIPFEFSFSGLKTAALTLIRSTESLSIPDFCASFQNAIIRCLTYKTFEACKHYNVSSLIIAGGVTANTVLQKTFQEESIKKGIHCTAVEKSLCTDNAAMIGLAAYHLSDYYPLSIEKIMAQSNLSI